VRAARARIRWAVGLLLVLVVVPLSAHAQHYPTTVAALLTESARYDNREVTVDGVVSAIQWSQVRVEANPPYEGLMQMFLLRDGPAAVWVVIVPARAALPGRGVPGAPPVGTRLGVFGVFRAASPAIELDRLVLR
jgi:hypothetical protein